MPFKVIQGHWFWYQSKARITGMRLLSTVHSVSKKFTLFTFVITRSNVDRFFWPYCIKLRKFANKMTYSFLIISSLCIWILRSRKTRNILYSMLQLRLAVVRDYCRFFESLFSPYSHQPLFRNSLIRFYGSITFKTYKFSIKILSSLLKLMFAPNH